MLPKGWIALTGAYVGEKICLKASRITTVKPEVYYTVVRVGILKYEVKETLQEIFDLVADNE